MSAKDKTICYNVIEKKGSDNMTNKLSLILYKESSPIFNIKNCDYINKDNVISFIYDNTNYRIINNEIFERENKEFKFTINLLKKECIYILKETNTTLSITVLNSSINIKEKEIIIKYNIETDNSDIKIIISFI